MSYEECQLCGKPVSEDQYPYCEKCELDLVDHMIREYNVFNPTIGVLTRNE